MGSQHHSGVLEEGQNWKCNPGQIVKGHTHDDFCSVNVFCNRVKKSMMRTRLEAGKSFIKANMVLGPHLIMMYLFGFPMFSINFPVTDYGFKVLNCFYSYIHFITFISDY